jgi:arsenate reductase (thioredoxin)
VATSFSWIFEAPRRDDDLPYDSMLERFRVVRDQIEIRMKMLREGRERERRERLAAEGREREAASIGTSASGQEHDPFRRA